ncbi:MAG TPA: urocanate hydratase [Acholeplasmataceae bacterium]|jgi:urocanate hydratase|nr:urocanate hydratase [Acholeplasmataceae bacterium]
MKINITLEEIFPELPEYPVFPTGIRRAPKRQLTLTEREIELALENALRYIPQKWHQVLAPEFLDELLTRGRIYGYRFYPKNPPKGLPIDQYLGRTLAGKAIQVMIDNNLAFDVALYPYELITYGETGAVMQNWMQYHLVKRYLQIMEEDQTLVVMSGHPLGLFSSHPNAPRVVITNGLMVGLYDDLSNWNRAASLGVASYGQMTAGGWMYIGPQGIVHGTYSTLLNAGRAKLGIPKDKDLAGHLFVSSGLGGMSGAQGKACRIAGGVGVIAEVDYSRIQTRLDQGWIDFVVKTPKEAFEIANQFVRDKKPAAIAFYGNIIDLLEFAVKAKIEIDLLSDQTSCHNAYEGGYCPAGISFEERTLLLQTNPETFKQKVDASLSRHYQAIKSLVERGTYFFDYGNSFMKAVFDSGIKEICKNGENPLDGFIWPSYVEDIMGPLLFDYGYGPFRWVVLSGKEEDLDATDQAAMQCIDPGRRFQDLDNYNWIKNAKENNLVVGTKARILYQDAIGRVKIALKFNEMVREGTIGPVMLGRDHHDTGGTDSPFRETANIKDGSNIMAEMATQVFAGNAARGMTYVALHNGGGVGIGKAINGGFGLLLDGSKQVDEILKSAITWDVMAGVARRAWARNSASIETATKFNENSSDNHITLPNFCDKDYLRSLVQAKLSQGGK